MQIVAVLGINLAILIGAFLLLWLIGIWLRDFTFIDAWWGIGMGVLATATFLQVPEPSARNVLLLVLCWLWSIRLGYYMLRRWRTEGTDRRYLRMLEKARDRRGWGPAMASMMLVILPQAPLQFLIGMPVQLGQLQEEATAPGILAALGAAVALCGLAWETVADVQLSAFRRDPANAGTVMSRGLWRYSRHPNYFGESCFWWGVFLIAAETAAGRFSVISPIVLTWILIRWSGAPTMEYRMRKHKPGYEEYVRSTSIFIPMPPRKIRN